MIVMSNSLRWISHGLSGSVDKVQEPARKGPAEDEGHGGSTEYDYFPSTAMM